MMDNSEQNIFFRNQNMSNDDDTWNDELLINLYDKALQIAKKDVAQRIAMETNTKVNHSNIESNTSDVKSNVDKKKKNKGKKNKNHETSSDFKWREGWNCRSIYSQDGLEYEAVIKQILDESSCIVSYIGYENEEIQLLKDLKQSWGKYTIIEQQEAAHRSTYDFDSKFDDSNDDDKLVNGVDEDEESENDHVKFENTSKYNHSKTNRRQLPQFDFPPFNPSMEFESHVPPPPPMPFTGGQGLLNEDKTLYSMLVSWYMSGYYTGLYQGQKMAQKASSRRHILPKKFKKEQ